MNKTTKCLLSIACLAIIITAGCKKDKEPPTVPSVTTAALTNITSSSATAGGTITSNGGAVVTASGIVLSKVNATPTLSDTVIAGTTSSGSFTSNITNLDFNTTYYIRAYATNSVGTGYGNVVTLNTIDDTTKVRFTYNGQTVTYGVIASPITGKRWMDRNLGASRVATAVDDAQAYGDLFQWGRLADGHQLRTSGTTDQIVSTDAPGHSNFILGINDPNADWRNPQNNNLWQGSNGTSKPCPTGWHVPTKAEWEAETGITNPNTAFSQFKLTMAGYRSLISGSVRSEGTEGGYHSSTVDGAQKFSLLIFGSSKFVTPGDRALGQSVRCIKD